MKSKKIENVGALPQAEIDFTTVVHRSENNKFSQKNLDSNRSKFTGQAAIILSELQKGVKLTADYAKDVHGIRHLARRIGDLGDAKRFKSEFGVDIDREWMRNEDLEQVNMLVYFLPENRGEFTAKKWIIDRPRWWYSDKYTPSHIIAEIKIINVGASKIIQK